MNSFLVVFLGAGIGGAARHGINIAVLRLYGPAPVFPYSTFAINILGSFLMGVLAGWFAYKAEPGQGWRLFLTTGILGGFTTFSTFSLETVLLWERGGPGIALGYVLTSIILGALALLLGLLLIRYLV